MHKINVNEQITCEILFCDRRNIKKLKRKKYIIQYGNYAIFRNGCNEYNYFISDFPTNGKLIIPYTKNSCKCINIDSGLVESCVQFSKAHYSRTMNKFPDHLYKTFFMFDNKSELMKWKLKNG